MISPDTFLQNQRDGMISSKQLDTKNVIRKNEIFKKQHIPPPMNASGVEMFGDLKKLIEEKTNKEYKYISHNNNIWKINVSDSDT